MIVQNFVVKNCVLWLLVLGLSGCSYAVTFNTNPIGANIICGGVNQGYSPVNLEYNKKALKEHNFRIESCETVWISGARIEFPDNISDVFEEFPKGVMLTLQRPEHPDLEKDMQFAFQVQQMKQQQMQFQYQQSQQAIHNVNQQLNQTNQRIQQQNHNNQMLFQMQQLNNTLRYGF